MPQKFRCLRTSHLEWASNFYPQHWSVKEMIPSKTEDTLLPQSLSARSVVHAAVFVYKSARTWNFRIELHRTESATGNNTKANLNTKPWHLAVSYGCQGKKLAKSVLNIITTQRRSYSSHAALYNTTVQRQSVCGLSGCVWSGMV